MVQERLKVKGSIIVYLENITALRKEHAFEVSLPIPAAPPVTMMTLPVRSGMSPTPHLALGGKPSVVAAEITWPMVVRKVERCVEEVVWEEGVFVGPNSSHLKRIYSNASGKNSGAFAWQHSVICQLPL